MSDFRNIDGADYLVYGGTEAGIFTAVSAARLGLKTVLISETEYLFGFFPSLGAWETHYPGYRAPLSTEVKKKIIDHYRENFGEDSVQFMECVGLKDNNPMVTFEPHIAEKVLQDLIDAESNLSVFKSCVLLKSHRKGPRLHSFVCRKHNRNLEFIAENFSDCSYTGDLAASAGAEFFIGRESRKQYGEPHAGRMFTRFIPGRYPEACVSGKLNLLPTWTTTPPLEGSTGEGDDRIQDYSYRVCLSNDPDNRIYPSRPAHYDRNRYAPLLLSSDEKTLLELPFHHRWLTQSIEEMITTDHLFHGHALPGNKRSWNATNLIGTGKDYANANPAKRKEIEKKHMEHALGLLYFLQNDSAVPQRVRQIAGEWGLPEDEFTNSNNLPPCLYVREARRFKGNYVYREQDCLKAEGINRAPIHDDAVSFTEFPLDSLPCSPDRVNGSLPDGQFFEKDKTLPGSLPWRCLRPLSIDNLLVPTAPSVSHCAWGTVRQTASLLQLAEVCGLAAALAKHMKKSIAELPVDRLQIYLVEQGNMISFFNDFDTAESEKWNKGALFFGNKGFFNDYDARPAEALIKPVAKLWIQKTKAILENQPFNPNELAQKVRHVEANGNKVSIDFKEFIQLLGRNDFQKPLTAILTRKEALEILYQVVLDAQEIATPTDNRI